MTERQAAAWPGAIAHLRALGADVPDSPHAWDIAYREESRPGRGHPLAATYFGDGTVSTITMDVYGYPACGTGTFELIHHDLDENCGCGHPSHFDDFDEDPDAPASDSTDQDESSD